MPLGHQGQSGMFALRQLGEGLRERRTRRERTEIAALTGAQSVAVLVHRPQVDTRFVEHEAVAVVEAGVFAVAMQEDHSRAGPRCRPVPVVDRAAVGVEEGHELDRTRTDASDQGPWHTKCGMAGHGSAEIERMIQEVVNCEPSERREKLKGKRGQGP